MCFVDHDESGRTLSDGMVKARKPHRCDECAGPIHVAEVHRRVAYVYEGGMGTTRLHVRCEAIRDAIHAHEVAEGCGYHESWAPLGECEDYLKERGLTYDDATATLVAIQVPS